MKKVNLFVNHKLIEPNYVNQTVNYKKKRTIPLLRHGPVSICLNWYKRSAIHHRA